MMMAVWCLEAADRKLTEEQMDMLGSELYID